jgi:hypothetical protein
MAPISLIETDQASPEVKEIYERTPRGKPGNAQKVLAHRSELYCSPGNPRTFRREAVR